jgi:hypothetical protein
MIVKRDAVVVEVIDQKDFDIVYGAKSVNPEGLMRIFEQYVVEMYPGAHNKVPIGKYRVSRTKWLFRQAVYKVEPLMSR